LYVATLYSPELSLLVSETPDAVLKLCRLVPPWRASDEGFSLGGDASVMGCPGTVDRDRGMLVRGISSATGGGRE
jgi:hypothetical protein